MNVTEASLRKVDEHWAVMSVGPAERDQGLKIADARLVKKSVGEQIAIALPDSEHDDDLLRRLALAYELAAVEGLPSLLNPTTENEDLRHQCAAGAWRTFDIRRQMPLPDQEDQRIFHVLHLSSLAYCGDRWSDLRRWFNDNENLIRVPSVANAQWDIRLLYRLFECWIRLFRKKRWDDLDRIREIIVGLRQDQATFESRVLNSGSNAEDRIMALRLIALYHWAKGTEVLAKYMLQGTPVSVASLLDKHFESATGAAAASADAQLEVLLRWLHCASRQMASGSIWWVLGKANSRVSKFIEDVTKRQAMFELLPPQKAALQEQGLLDQAATAIVIDMPTSGGKTLLAEFRILQALNLFEQEKGWVAYVAPTRALSAQITRRLRRDFDPIGVKVEQLSGAVEIDSFEEAMLTADETVGVFDVLVCTPEKLQLVIRNKKVLRPLALVVMDEAHNMQDVSRGLRIELLLATIKRDCASANFLLLMPYVDKADSLARWLAQDINAGRAISIGTSPWKPNERIVGMFSTRADESIRGGWQLEYQTLTTSPKTIQLDGVHKVGGVKPLNVSRSKLSQSLETAAMASIMSQRGTSIAVALRIDHVWSMARRICESTDAFVTIPSEIRLVQDFLRTEISPQFELVDMLSHGVGVHHAGLSDETRTLIEWLSEEGKLRVLCATTTIAQGINFPVSSVFLASRFLPQDRRSVEMPTRDFWNLAGRAGRMNHDNLGVVGIAAGNKPNEIVEYVSRATGELISRLVTMLDELERVGRLDSLESVIQSEQWDDFRCYIAHLWSEKQSLDDVLADTEQLLRNTYGYVQLRNSTAGKQKAERLLEATRSYARRLSANPGHAALADLTGFSPEGVGKALAGMAELNKEPSITDWAPDSLFGESSSISNLFGVMLRIPQLAESLRELGGHGDENKHIADVAKAWVGGVGIQQIANEYFRGTDDQTKAITVACKAIYRNLVNSGTWGISALARLSGIDFDRLSEAERRQINLLPAMIYHGVRSEAAVLMRMNSVPRSCAEKMGLEMSKEFENFATTGVQHARQFLRDRSVSDWEHVRPEGSSLSGAGYKTVWEILSGERH